MSDLRVDTRELDDAAATIDRTVGTIRETAFATTAMSQLCWSAGNSGLVEAGEDFLGRWEYGLGCVADDGDSVIELLKTAAAGFADVENKLAAALPQGTP